jgi:hypothetical protein
MDLRHLRPRCGNTGGGASRTSAAKTANRPSDTLLHRSRLWRLPDHQHRSAQRNGSRGGDGLASPWDTPVDHRCGDSSAPDTRSGDQSPLVVGGITVSGRSRTWMLRAALQIRFLIVSWGTARGKASVMHA